MDFINKLDFLKYIPCSDFRVANCRTFFHLTIFSAFVFLFGLLSFFLIRLSTQYSPIAALAIQFQIASLLLTLYISPLPMFSIGQSVKCVPMYTLLKFHPSLSQKTNSNCAHWDTITDSCRSAAPHSLID